MNWLDVFTKRYKLDLRYFMRAGFYSSMRFGIDILFGILFVYLLTRYFSESDMGRYFLTIAILGTLGVFTVDGFRIAATNSFIRNIFSSYKTAFSIRFAGGLIASLLSIIGAAYAYTHYPSIWKFLILIAIVIPLLSSKLYLRYLYAKDLFGRQALISLIEKTYYLIASMCIVLGYDLLTVLSVFLGFQAAYNGFFTIIYYIKIKQEENTKSKDRTLISSGFKFSFIQVFELLVLHLDKIVLSYFMGLQQLAIYSIALIIPNNLFALTKKLTRILIIKKSVRLSENTVKTKIRTLLPQLILIFGIASVIIWFATPFVFKYIFPDYTDGILYAQLFSTMLFFNFIADINKRQLESHARAGTFIKREITTSTAQIIMYIIAIPLWGIPGALVARITGIAIRFLYSI